MRYSYKEMLANAKKAGVTSEKKMWDAIEGIEDVLRVMEVHHPEDYWRFMRAQHGILYGCHYDEAFARYDVAGIKYVNREGKERSGERWTVDEALSAFGNLRLPEGTTKWDVYVALNSFYADMCQELDDEQIVRSAWRFYFKDEDGPKGKVWLYMAAMRHG
jgi:hypothetical protein